jgi:hypothetical protein
MYSENFWKREYFTELFIIYSENFWKREYVTELFIIYSENFWKRECVTELFIMYSELLGFWGPYIFLNSDQSEYTAYRNLDLFPFSDEGGETFTLLVPIERDNLIDCSNDLTDTVYSF